MKSALVIILAAGGALAAFAAWGHDDQKREAAMARPEVADRELGGRLYARTCSVCHGEQGDATSWAKNSLYPPPRDFTSAAGLQLTRQGMIDAVTFGVPGTAMMPFTTQFSRAEIVAVVDYIRTAFMDVDPSMAGGHEHARHASLDLAAPFPGALVGRADLGQASYESNCAACHGIEGDGRGPRAYFLSRKPRDFTSERTRSGLNRPHLFEAIAKGVRRTEMAAWSKVLSAQEIADVAEYVFTAFVDREHSAAPPAPDDAEGPGSKKN